MSLENLPQDSRIKARELNRAYDESRRLHEAGRESYRKKIIAFFLVSATAIAGGSLYNWVRSPNFINFEFEEQLEESLREIIKPEPRK